MSTIQDPRAGTTTKAAVGSAFKALSLGARPCESQGHYRLSGVGGAVQSANGLNASAPIMSFVYGGPGVCVVHTVRATVQLASVMTIAKCLVLDLQSRRYLPDLVTEKTTTGTYVFPSKLNSKYPDSNSIIRFLAAAPVQQGLGLGVGSNDPRAHASTICFLATALNLCSPAQDFWGSDLDCYPMVLEAGQGFVIALSSATSWVSASGTGTFLVELGWSETFPVFDSTDLF